MSDVDLFLSHPSAYFGFSQTRMLGLSRDELEELQLAGLKRRFEQFRGKLAMMDKLADLQNVHAVEQLNDVLPLLFDHATYKSYPPSLLEKHRYTQLTAWLSKLTTVDLSKLDVSACRSIDDWLMTIDRETELAVCHTSGTSGSMSFLPWSKGEWRKMLAQYPVLFFQVPGDGSPAPQPPLNLDCIYPFFRSGGLSHTVINDALVDVIAGGEERFHAAFPQRLSADILLLATKRRVAAAKGQLDQFQLDPALEARHEEFAAQQAEMPQRIAAFFEDMRTRLAGRRVYVQAANAMLYNLAEDGLGRGLRNIFAPDSVIITGGGGKGMVLPDDWQDKVKEFFGVKQLNNNYGMSEMTGLFKCCNQGNHHGVPWVIPYLLDPDSSQPLPRQGRVSGRFAFYDLLMDSRWGGFVTGDEVTFEWDKPCACGQTGPHIVGGICRLSDRKNEAGEEKLSCAAAPDAYAEALDFLNGTPV